MKKLDQALEKLKFDTRMVDSNIKNGIVTKSDVESHLSQLSDNNGNYENIELEEANGSAEPVDNESLN